MPLNCILKNYLNGKFYIIYIYIYFFFYYEKKSSLDVFLTDLGLFLRFTQCSDGALRVPVTAFSPPRSLVLLRLGVLGLSLPGECLLILRPRSWSPLCGPPSRLTHPESSACPPVWLGYSCSSLC